MADAHDGSEEPPIALQVQGNIDIDGKEEAFSLQNSALAGSSGTRRRHNTSSSLTPMQQVSVGRNQGNNSININVGTSVKVEEEALPPIPLAGGSQGDVELGGCVDVSQGDNQQQDEQASQSQQQPETHAGSAGGLPAQALMTLIGEKYLETVGQIIALIGLGTITSTIGGFFTRGPPALFVYFFTNQYWDADTYLRDALVQRDAVILYYKCLPAFFIVGLLELCYGIWVSRNQLRAGKRAKTILILSAIMLIVTVCFTGAGVSV